jgi:hypothetical protein
MSPTIMNKTTVSPYASSFWSELLLSSESSTTTAAEEEITDDDVVSLQPEKASQNERTDTTSVASSTSPHGSTRPRAAATAPKDQMPPEMAIVHTTKETLHPYDVLLDRGPSIYTHSGNVFFQQTLLDQLRPAYTAVRIKLQPSEKKEFWKKVLHAITRRGGTFVRKEEIIVVVEESTGSRSTDNQNKVTQYTTVDLKTALDKIGQALREPASKFSTRRQANLLSQRQPRQRKKLNEKDPRPVVALKRRRRRVVKKGVSSQPPHLTTN